MMHHPGIADFLFIALIAGLIWGIMWLVGRSRHQGSPKTPAADENQDTDTQ